MKVVGNQSYSRAGNYAGVRSHEVASYGSDLSPTWLNIVAKQTSKAKVSHSF